MRNSRGKAADAFRLRVYVERLLSYELRVTARTATLGDVSALPPALPHASCCAPCLARRGHGHTSGF